MALKEYYLFYSSIFLHGKIRSKTTRIDAENFITYLHIIGADDAYLEVDPDQSMH